VALGVQTADLSLAVNAHVKIAGYTTWSVAGVPMSADAQGHAFSDSLRNFDRQFLGAACNTSAIARWTGLLNEDAFSLTCPSRRDLLGPIRQLR